MKDVNGLSDAEYREYVLQAIRAGLEAVKNGEILEQEEVEKRMSRWLRDDEGSND